MNIEKIKAKEHQSLQAPMHNVAVGFIQRTIWVSVEVEDHKSSFWPHLCTQVSVSKDVFRAGEGWRSETQPLSSAKGIGPFLPLCPMKTPLASAAHTGHHSMAASEGHEQWNHCRRCIYSDNLMAGYCAKDRRGVRAFPEERARGK